MAAKFLLLVAVEFFFKNLATSKRFPNTHFDISLADLTGHFRHDSFVVSCILLPFLSQSLISFLEVLDINFVLILRLNDL